MAERHISTITLEVALDDNRIPERISWSAEDGGVVDEEAKAFLLSVWDQKNRESLKIDLWTKDMPLDDMKIFFHQTLLGLRETYFKATQDERMSATMKDFCDYFAEHMDD